MLIRHSMVHIKSICFILFIGLLSAFVLLSLRDRESTEEVFLSQLVNTATGEVDQEMAEQLWMGCRLDLICLRGDNEFLNFCSPEKIPTMTTKINRENVQKLFKVLQPHLKQILLDCVRRGNHFFDGSREDVGSLFARRTFLKRVLLQSTPPSPSPVSESPLNSPTSSPPAPEKLEPSSDSTPLSPALTPGKSFFPKEGDDAPAISEETSAVPASNQPTGGNSNRTSIVIAVAVTAGVTFILAALFFLCCTRICKGSSAARQNDESPLLSLSLSDYSTGSSLKSFGMGGSIKEEKLGNQHLTSNHERKSSVSVDSFNIKSDSFQTSLGETQLGAAGDIEQAPALMSTSNKMNGLLPPPPGRMVSNPPLKPPPGRAVPLPPEPPASIRPPSRAGLPPPAPPPAPTPPPPPPPKASSSIGSRPPGPPPPPMAPAAKGGPRPPPPPMGGAPRPPPSMSGGPKIPRPPLPSMEADDAPKAKLKPFFWDKVLANPDNSMVWHQIKAGSFQFNEEMIETLFGYTAGDKNKNERKKDVSQDPQFVQILDHKKSRNLSILLRALNVTIEEVCDALTEGNELPAELLQTLLKMAPTQDEELKLRLFNGELSQLGPAERFLKSLIDIPFAFKRMEILLFMCTMHEDAASTKESFETLEVACKELRSSRLFLKLLEAVLKTGNRMNDGTYRGRAQAFKLDTLLKLADVKGVDGKTTLLHFVVQEIIRSEGVRAARTAKQSQSFSGLSMRTEDLLEDITPDTEEHYRSLGLQVVSCLSHELENVKKAAVIDADSLTGMVSRLGHSLLKARDFLNKEMMDLEEDGGFRETLKSFVQTTEVDITSLLEEEKRVMALVKSTGDYFHGSTEKNEGIRLFVIVRDFLIMVDKVCKQIEEAQKKSAKLLKKEASTASSTSTTVQQPSSSPNVQQPSPDVRPRLFSAIAERRVDSSSSSDDES